MKKLFLIIAFASANILAYAQIDRTSGSSYTCAEILEAVQNFGDAKESRNKAQLRKAQVAFKKLKTKNGKVNCKPTRGCSCEDAQVSFREVSAQIEDSASSRRERTSTRNSGASERNQRANTDRRQNGKVSTCTEILKVVESAGTALKSRNKSQLRKAQAAIKRLNATEEGKVPCKESRGCSCEDAQVSFQEINSQLAEY